MAAIILSQNGREIRRVTLSKNLLIGRAPQCDIAIQNAERLSREHCRVERVEGGWSFTDLNSSNGSFLADRRITKHVLRDRDVIRVGVVSLHFFAAALPAEAPATKGGPKGNAKSHDEMVLELLEASAQNLDESFAGLPAVETDDSSEVIPAAKPEPVARPIERSPAPAASARRIGPSGPGRINFWEQAVEPVEEGTLGTSESPSKTGAAGTKARPSSGAFTLRFTKLRSDLKNPRTLVALIFAIVSIGLILYQFSDSIVSMTSTSHASEIIPYSQTE